jgi:hypothetical protein
VSPKRKPSTDEFAEHLDRLSDWLVFARKAREAWARTPHPEYLRSAYVDGLKAAAALLEQKGHAGLARDVRRLAKADWTRSKD